MKSPLTKYTQKNEYSSRRRLTIPSDRSSRPVEQGTLKSKHIPMKTELSSDNILLLGGVQRGYVRPVRRIGGNIKMESLSSFIKRISVLSLLLLITIWIGLRPAVAQDDVKEQLVVPLTDPGKPGSLEVGLVNGSIHVIGYSGKEVIIDATSVTRKGGKHDDDDEEEDDDNDNLNNNTNTNHNKPSPAGMKRISGGNSLELTAEERNNRVEVNSDSWKRAVNLTIKVPQQFSLKLNTVNHGTIIVENVRGEIEVENVNGAVELSDITGSVVANTVNGNVIVKFKDITPNAPMAFTTLNGNVDVTFPASLKASAKMKSERGEIYSDFDMTVEKSQPKVDRSTQTGAYRVSIEDWVYAKINGGGAQILMKNMNGNIYLRKLK